MNKFKVGNKVKVINTVQYNGEVSIGDTALITGIGHFKEGLILEWINTKNYINPRTNSSCGWPREMFELIEEKKKMFVTCKGSIFYDVEIAKEYSYNGDIQEYELVAIHSQSNWIRKEV